MPAKSPLLPVALLFAGLIGLAAATAAPLSAAETATRSDDAVTATLAGEFALQAGRLDEAAHWYFDAARAADGDAGLAERATRIALLANDDAGAGDALKLWRQRAPRSLAMRAAEATLSLHRNDGRAARRELEALMRDRGTDTAADGWRYALAALGSGSKDPKLSATLLGELLDADAIPDQLQAWLAFGGLAQHLDQDALAERIVDEVVKRFPGEPRVALLRASQLRESGKPDAAAQVLAGIAAQADRDADLRLSIAAEYDALGQPAMAAATLARGPQDEQSYSLRASLLAKAEDKAALGKLYDELKQGATTPDPQRRLLLGQTAEFLERHAEALEWYRSVPGGPQRWQARLRAANVLHELKQSDQAYAELRQLQADAAANDDVRRDAYLLEADLRQKDKNLAGELDSFARGLAAFPDDGALLYARSLSWERRDDIARAEADLRKVLVAEPDNVAALNALGYTLADRTTRYPEALELIDRARVAEPDNAAIIDSYGWVLYRLGRHDEALVALRRAFALQKDPEIAAHLGEVLWVSGHKDEARKFFDEGRKLDPENRSLQRALSRTGA
ncbi:MAG TPA: tetratricopeptide repeat protein [Luteimonas sp.]|nr:tetratricopeptide repeat protein [Luteimonas sp.]